MTNTVDYLQGKAPVGHSEGSIEVVKLYFDGTTEESEPIFFGGKKLGSIHLPAAITSNVHTLEGANFSTNVESGEFIGPDGALILPKAADFDGVLDSAGAAISVTLVTANVYSLPDEFVTPLWGRLVQASAAETTLYLLLKG